MERGPTEHVVMANMLLRFGRGATRLFRINSGMGWVGKILSRTKDMIVLDNPRPFHGAPAGSSDLIGWHSITVTPDMVGRRLAVFVAVEVKTRTGRERTEQQRFVDAVRRSGGVALFARDEQAVADALAAAGRAPCETPGCPGVRF